MNEIQTLEAEIGRLKFLNAEEHKTIEELSRLCLRAADALETWGSGRLPYSWDSLARMIAELREAAE